MGPKPVALATHYSEWVELRRSEWEGPVVVAAERRQLNAMQYLQRERETNFNA